VRSRPRLSSYVFVYLPIYSQRAAITGSVFFCFGRDFLGKVHKSGHILRENQKLEVAFFPKDILITIGLLTTKTAPFSIA
jgi:hypothetical protein